MNQLLSTAKLTVLQHNRLVELRDVEDHRTRRSWMTRHAGSQKATTAKLETLGLVEIKFRKIAKTGRVMAQGDAYLTDLGREAIERYPLKVRARCTTNPEGGEHG